IWAGSPGYGQCRCSALRLCDLCKKGWEYLSNARKKADSEGMKLNFDAANAAAKRFYAAAKAMKQLQEHPTSNEAALNTALRQTEEDLLSQEGLPNRSWYKHTIYAPGEYTGYAAV